MAQNRRNSPSLVADLDYDPTDDYGWLWDDDESNIPPRYGRRYQSPSRAEIGYQAPSTTSGPKRILARVDGALGGKNLGYTLAALIVIFGLVTVLWIVTHKRR